MIDDMCYPGKEVGSPVFFSGVNFFFKRICRSALFFNRAFSAFKKWRSLNNNAGFKIPSDDTCFENKGKFNGVMFSGSLFGLCFCHK